MSHTAVSVQFVFTFCSKTNKNFAWIFKTQSMPGSHQTIFYLQNAIQYKIMIYTNDNQKLKIIKLSPVRFVIFFSTSLNDFKKKL